MTTGQDLLVSLLHKAFDGVRWLVDDMDDEDCFWEPATPCWSVRPRADAGQGWGTGDWVCEDAWPPPDPLPITTIAWRLAHLAAWTDIYRGWTFEDRRPGLAQLDVPGTRDGLVDWVHRAQDAFLAAGVALNPPDLAAPPPAHCAPHLAIPRLVGIIAVEPFPPGAEIGVLRDLRRGGARVQPPPINEEPR